MMHKRPSYHSYLIQIWWSEKSGKASWQMMLVNPHTDERHGFTSLEELLSFLQQELARSEMKLKRR
jgi:hypothetical protein